MADTMINFDKKLISEKDGSYRYVLTNPSKYKIKVVFTDSVNSNKVEKEITSILKNNYIERTLSLNELTNRGDTIL